MYIRESAYYSRQSSVHTYGYIRYHVYNVLCVCVCIHVFFRKWDHVFFIFCFLIVGHFDISDYEILQKVCPPWSWVEKWVLCFVSLFCFTLSSASCLPGPRLSLASDTNTYFQTSLRRAGKSGNRGQRVWFLVTFRSENAGRINYAYHKNDSTVVSSDVSGVTPFPILHSPACGKRARG